jgi:hypothetical protein
MNNNDENKPASIEDLNSISPERWAELDAMSARYEAWREKVNLVPHNASGEQYIRNRYPITALYDRAALQEIAESDFDAILTETEMQVVADAFYDDFPHEIHEAISNAIEYVLNQRQNRYEQNQSQGNT